MAAPGIVLVKSFQYRDATEEWSNGYHIQGDAPANDTEWKAQFDALIALEQTLLYDNVKYERAYGYDNFDGTHASVSSFNYGAETFPPFGSLTSSGQIFKQGLTCVVCKWDTGRRNTKGKPVYLFKYFHGVADDGTATEPDKLKSAQHTAGASFATDVITPGMVWQGIAGPDGVAPVSGVCNLFSGSHQLHRRGKRPNP